MGSSLERNLIMAMTEYRKAFADANGDKAAYLKACEAFDERNQGTARILWTQFMREITPRVCICANGGELVRFLKMLPSGHEDFQIVTASSEEVEHGYVLVNSNPVTKIITITGAI